MAGMSRVFVYEYLSGGGDTAADGAGELLAMGRAMRDAMAADLLALKNYHVTVATCKLAGPPALPARTVTPEAGEAAPDFVRRQAAALMRELLRVLTGAGFHEADTLVSVVSVSMWVGGYASYLNRDMELNKRFGAISTVRAVGAGVNVVLNFLLVPRYGMMGAAWATLLNRLLNAGIFFAVRDVRLVRVPLRPLMTAGLLSAGAWLVSGLLPAASLWQMVLFVLLYAPVALLAMRRGHS